MIRQPEQRGMAPIARVELLAVKQQKISARHGVRVGSEVRDVGDALLLVHYKILDDVQVLGLALEREMLRRVAVRPAVVHVHVEIPAPPAQRREIRESIQDDPP